MRGHNEDSFVRFFIVIALNQLALVGGVFVPANASTIDVYCYPVNYIMQRSIDLFKKSTVCVHKVTASFKAIPEKGNRRGEERSGGTACFRPKGRQVQGTMA